MHTVTHYISKADLNNVMDDLFATKQIMRFVGCDYFGNICCDSMADALFIGKWLKEHGYKCTVHINYD